MIYGDVSCSSLPCAGRVGHSQMGGAVGAHGPPADAPRAAPARRAILAPDEGARAVCVAEGAASSAHDRIPGRVRAGAVVGVRPVAERASFGRGDIVHHEELSARRGRQR